MVIRTIALLQECYVALRGYWRWRDLSGFHSISLRVLRPDIIFNDPPTFTSPSRRLTLTYGTSSAIYTGGIDLFDDLEAAVTESMLTGPEDDSDSSVDCSLYSVEFELPSPLYPSQVDCGLGISGLLAKDGNGPFTGLGVISIRPFPWRHIPSTDSTSAVEKTKLWVMVETIPQSRLNYDTGVASHTQALHAISHSENGPNSTEAHRLVAEPLPICSWVAPANDSILYTSTPLRPAKNFSAPTISSKLKKITKTSSPISSPTRNCCRRIYAPGPLVLVSSYAHQVQQGNNTPIPRILSAVKTAAYTRSKALIIGAVDLSKSARHGAPTLAVKNIPRWR